MTHRRRTAGAAAVAVIGLLLLPDAGASADSAAATVTSVIDGDTVNIRYDTGGTDKVRILGIDTPETKAPGKPIQCWGPEATEFARTELAGRRVVLNTDPTQDTRDRYDRLLAYVDRDGWNYSVGAARAGAAHAYTYDTPVTLSPQIAAAEQQARTQGCGLWGPPCNGQP